MFNNAFGQQVPGERWGILSGLVIAAFLVQGTCLAQHWVQNSDNGHYYALTNPANWQDARQQAEDWGGYLVTINDAEENFWLLIESNLLFDFHVGQNSSWIGLADSEVEGSWVWSNGETEAYRNWIPGQPDSLGNEDYVEINGEGMSSPGQWNDASGSRSQPGIVERETEPSLLDSHKFSGN